jgi:hypothetical protein
MVRLPGPVALTRAEPRIGSIESRRWYGPRVPLPPLSIDALRVDDPSTG